MCHRVKSPVVHTKSPGTIFLLYHDYSAGPRTETGLVYAILKHLLYLCIYNILQSHWWWCTGWQIKCPSIWIVCLMIAEIHYVHVYMFYKCIAMHITKFIDYIFMIHIHKCIICTLYYMGG